ncbi:MAG: hypothetical protein ACP5QZ_11700, partial [Candidatus Sumerlaeaceae bacterium]
MLKARKGTTVDEKMIEAIVEEVVRRLGPNVGAGGTGAQFGATSSRRSGSPTGLRGVYTTIEDAIEAAWHAQKRYADATLETR